MHKLVKNNNDTDREFAQDVDKGLSADVKHLSSKYFYDAEGDRLFQQIMGLPEYYLTRAEYEIFKTHAADIVQHTKEQQPVQLIELGAGDGTKTKLILKALLDDDINFTYFPIDISGNALRLLSDNIKKDFADDIDIHPIEGDYFKALQSPALDPQATKLILFLGSTIGNFPEQDVHAFLYKLAGYMNKGDKLLLGFDLKKDPQIILDAYNDKKGVTRAFNMNLLKRINRELDADFDLSAFYHYPVYDPVAGAAKSYIVSNRDQQVHIKALNKSFHFKKHEPVYTEISRKYDLDVIRNYASLYDLTLKDTFYDSRQYFADVLFEKDV